MASFHSLRIRIIRSGSSGNAIFLEGGGTRLVVDVGLPAEVVARELASLPDATPIDAILLTHEHEDHAKGAGVLSRALGAPVLANEGTLSAAAAILNGAERERFATGVPFRVGELEVEAFPVPHDAVEPVGFAISSGPIRVLIATDPRHRAVGVAARRPGRRPRGGRPTEWHNASLVPRGGNRDGVRPADGSTSRCLNGLPSRGNPTPSSGRRQRPSSRPRCGPWTRRPRCDACWCVAGTASASTRGGTICARVGGFLSWGPARPPPQWRPRWNRSWGSVLPTAL